MDISFRVQLAAEMREDRWSIAQSDIEQYDDQIEPIAMTNALRWAVVRQCEAARCLTLRVAPSAVWSRN
jgi:hypothetical protein